MSALATQVAVMATASRDGIAVVLASELATSP